MKSRGIGSRAVGAVIDPFTGGRDPLASGNDCAMANHGQDVAMPARPGPQHADRGDARRAADSNIGAQNPVHSDVE
jgi:hypothetical protein